ncbi:hypothetical protein D3C76_1541680 [compost metagenome]
MDNMNREIQGISGGTQELSAGMEQLRHSFEHCSLVAESSYTESSIAVGQAGCQSKLVQENTESMTRLSRAVHELNDQIAKYKVVM